MTRPLLLLRPGHHNLFQNSSSTQIRITSVSLKLIRMIPCLPKLIQSRNIHFLLLLLAPASSSTDHLQTRHVNIRVYCAAHSNTNAVVQSAPIASSFQPTKLTVISRRHEGPAQTDRRIVAPPSPSLRASARSILPEPARGSTLTMPPPSMHRRPPAAHPDRRAAHDRPEEEQKRKAAAAAQSTESRCHAWVRQLRTDNLALCNQLEDLALAASGAGSESVRGRDDPDR